MIKIKIDRLLGITVYLLNRDKISARLLAERFEVSQRTIQRDIDCLCMAGIPIVSTAGSNGGYEIIDTFKTSKQAINNNDYINIVTALRGLCSAYSNKDLDATIEKLIAEGSLSQSEQKMFFDLSILREKNNINDYIDFINIAINDKKTVKFNYCNSAGKISEKLVEPIAIIYRWYSWYMFGYTIAKEDYSLYKLCRINDLTKTNLDFCTTHKSADILLNEYDSNDKNEYYDIKIICKSAVRSQVREYLSDRIIEELDNGDFIIEMYSPQNERMWFSLLLGFGDSIRVIEPEEVIKKIKDTIQGLNSLYK